MRKALVVFLVLLAGGLIAADRIGVLLVQREVAERLAVQYSLPQRPEVTIHGLPFLTQAIGGEYRQVDVAIGDFTRQEVTLRDVRVRIENLRAPLSEAINGDTSGVVAGTATASAILPYDLIKRHAPANVTRIGASGSDLEVELTGSLLGFSLNGTAVLSAEVSRDGIRITPRSVATQGLRVPLGALRGPLSWTVPVPELPLGSRISRVEITEAGIRVGATAHDVAVGELAGR